MNEFPNVHPELKFFKTYLIEVDFESKVNKELRTINKPIIF